VLASRDMRGPLLSGPLGSAAALDAIGRWCDGARTVVVIGPLWLAEVLSGRVRVLLLVEPEERPRARRAARRMAGAAHRFTVALAGVDLPLVPRSVDALLVESAATLDAEARARWFSTLVQVIRPGGRLIAVDATPDVAVEARLAGLFLACALTEIVQERPRQGVLLTVGVAPPASISATRFRAVGSIGYPGTERD